MNKEKDEILWKIVVRICGAKTGTGFYIDKNRILTAYHIIDKNLNKYIEIMKDEEGHKVLKGKVLDYSENFDLALLEVEEEIKDILPINIIKIEENQEWRSYTCVDAMDDDDKNIFDKCLIKGEVYQNSGFNKNQVYDIHLDGKYLESSPYNGDYKGCSGSPLVIGGKLTGVIIKEEISNRKSPLKVISFDKSRKFLEKNNIESFVLGRNPKLDLSWYKDSIDNSIKNLGYRYNENLNVEVEISSKIEKISLNSNYSGIFDELKNDICEINIIFNHSNELIKTKEWVIKRIEDIKELLIENIELDFSDLINNISELVDSAENIMENKNLKYNITDDYSILRDFPKKINRINESIKKLEDYQNCLKYKVILIEGEAGVGKSHTIADIIKDRVEKFDIPSVFILGQHITKDENPQKQIVQCLDIDLSFDDLLDEMNLWGELKNEYCIIGIDAINESLHSNIWENYLNGIINKVSKYRWLKLIITVRSTYKEKCIPPDVSNNKKVFCIKHKGFYGNSLKAIRDVFNHYKVPVPNFTILRNEFTNPLFLITFCKTIKNNNIDVAIEDYSCFTLIFEEFFNSINRKISKKLNYPEEINLVIEVISNIIENNLDKTTLEMEFKDICAIIKKQVSEYEVDYNKFLNLMISEGIFYKDSIRKDRFKRIEILRFSYERYEKYLLTKYLLNQYEDVESLKEAINNRQDLGKYFSLKSEFFDSGIIEEMYIQIPDKYKIEVFEIYEQKHKIFIECFIKSLIWRNKDRLDINSEIFKNYVNKNIIGEKRLCVKWFDMLIITSTINRHPLNSNFMHKWMSKFSMPKRDGFLTYILHDMYFYDMTLKTLIDICLEDEGFYINYESAKLLSITLAWTFVSPYRELRDKATKALVNILTDNIGIAKELLIKFKDINDPYVLERIYCSIYGAVSRSKSLRGIKDLSLYIYEEIFNKEYVYPHILLRDYARSIIQFTINQDVDINIKKEKINPRYNSKWYDYIPSDDEIRSYEYDYTSDTFKDIYWGQNDIVSSMITEYGRGISGYGDFGRYVFQSSVYKWEEYFKPQELSNIAIKRIFEMGYDVNLHGDYDNNYTSKYGRHDNDRERIGKKYQWIAYFEILAKLSDNFKIVEDNFTYSTKDDNTYIEVQGPWNPFVRDIDPTVCLKSETIKTEKGSIINSLHTINNEDSKLWLHDSSSLPDFNKVLNINYKGEEFILLSGHLNWYNEDKKLFMKASGLIVENDNIEKYLQDKRIYEYSYSHHWKSVYNLFSREFYNSAAYEDCKKSGEININESDIIDTTLEYLWECENDYSKEYIIRYLMPSEYIVNELNLKQLKDGFWYDEFNNLICTDLALEGYETALIINKSKFDKLLKKNNKNIIWDVYISKEIKKERHEWRKVIYCEKDIVNEYQYGEDSWKTRF